MYTSTKSGHVLLRVRGHMVGAQLSEARQWQLVWRGQRLRGEPGEAERLFLDVTKRRIEEHPQNNTQSVAVRKKLFQIGRRRSKSDAIFKVAFINVWRISAFAQ